MMPFYGIYCIPGSYPSWDGLFDRPVSPEPELRDDEVRLEVQQQDDVFTLKPSRAAGPRTPRNDASAGTSSSNDEPEADAVCVEVNGNRTMKELRQHIGDAFPHQMVTFTILPRCLLPYGDSLVRDVLKPGCSLVCRRDKMPANTLEAEKLVTWTRLDAAASESLKTYEKLVRLAARAKAEATEARKEAAGERTGAEEEPVEDEDEDEEDEEDEEEAAAARRAAERKEAEERKHEELLRKHAELRAQKLCKREKAEEAAADFARAKVPVFSEADAIAGLAAAANAVKAARKKVADKENDAMDEAETVARGLRLWVAKSTLAAAEAAWKAAKGALAAVKARAAAKEAHTAMRSADGDDVCSICQDKVDPAQRMTIDGCRHVFHLECLTTWCQKQPRQRETEDDPTCPNCRDPFKAFVDVQGKQHDVPPLEGTHTRSGSIYARVEHFLDTTGRELLRLQQDLPPAAPGPRYRNGINYSGGGGGGGGSSRKKRRGGGQGGGGKKRCTGGASSTSDGAARPLRAIDDSQVDSEDESEDGSGAGAASSAGAATGGGATGGAAGASDGGSQVDSEDESEDGSGAGAASSAGAATGGSQVDPEDLLGMPDADAMEVLASMTEQGAAASMTPQQQRFEQLKQMVLDRNLLVGEPKKYHLRPALVAYKKNGGDTMGLIDDRTPQVRHKTFKLPEGYVILQCRLGNQQGRLDYQQGKELKLVVEALVRPAFKTVNDGKTDCVEFATRDGCAAYMLSATAAAQLDNVMEKVNQRPRTRLTTPFASPLAPLSRACPRHLSRS